ncbi:MAG TPA: M20 family metallopeptidase [Burkholderiaceae bacterium]|nr:M20 family metallopeptidase [Burkholderiaceae bacterium]
MAIDAATISTNDKSLIEGIREWVMLESPSHDIERVGKMMVLAGEQARRMGLRTDLIDLGAESAKMLHVTNRQPGDVSPGLLIIAHLDTVHPVGTLRVNACRQEGDRLYGPGVYDMKAGAYLALCALGEAARNGGTALPVDFLFSPDEEIGSPASRSHIERFAGRAHCVLVTEPARPNGGRCVTARKGTGVVKVKIIGRPAHAGMQHENGRSAIKEMAHQVLALEAMTDYARGITVSVGTIRGGTTTNVVPSECEAIVDFRVPDAEAAEFLLARVRAMKAVDPDVTLSIDAALNRPPMARDENTAALFATASDCANRAGFSLEEAPMTGGGSDANFTAALGIPTIDGLGADGDGAHTLKEYVLVSTLAQRLAFWKELLRGLR